jgi:sugar lactone lactonase YvrE
MRSSLLKDQDFHMQYSAKARQLAIVSLGALAPCGGLPSSRDSNDGETSMADFELLVDGRNIVGEGPTWDDRRHCLWWTDIMSKMLYRLDWPGGELMSFPMPRRLGSLGLCESGRLILAFEDGVFLHEPGTDRFDIVASIEPEIVTNRLNDGKVGPDGAFWVGSMDERSPRQPTGALYRVTMDGAVKQFGDVIVSNGLAWSPDGRTMIHTDSSVPAIDAWDFDAVTGAISNRRRIARPANEIGRPDGGAFDIDGFYWSAGVSAGHLNCWGMTGTLVKHMPLPMPHPTMPCFGGPDLKTVFITSLRAMGVQTDLERWPQSGGLLMGTLGVAGAPVHRFRDI